MYHFGHGQASPASLVPHGHIVTMSGGVADKGIPETELFMQLPNE